MSDLKLFRTSNKGVSEIQGSAMALEKPLQTLIEENMEDFLGVRFLVSEYITSDGIIDSLGIDENNSPVIIEYKRSKDENVINQGLSYLNWLMGHRSDFKWLVMERYGQKQAERIDWSAPRLICIANSFNKRDMPAVNQMNPNILLLRYRRFGDDLLLLEVLTSTAERSTMQASSRKGGDGLHLRNARAKRKTVGDSLSDASPELANLYKVLEDYLLGLGDDVQMNTLECYVAFRRKSNFACVEVKSQVRKIKIHVKVNPDEIELESGFTRDVRNVGHFGTGDLEITITDMAEFEKAKPLFERGYDNA